MSEQWKDEYIEQLEDQIFLLQDKIKMLKRLLSEAMVLDLIPPEITCWKINNTKH